MLLDIVKKDSTDRSVVIRICDSSDGTPETGVVYNTAGIDLWYRREGAAKTSITEATLAALTTAHADGGFLHVGDGVYRLDLPDAAVATGANYVDVGGTVTGMVVFGGRVRLTNFDLEDAVRGGLTALPNAAADAAGGLPISDAGGLDIDAKLANTNEVTTARMGALTDWINGGRLDLLLDAIKVVTDALPDSGALSSLATAAALTTAQDDLDILTGSDGATLATTQGNYAPATAAALATAQDDLDIITGADGVNLLSATQASIDAIEADTSELQTNQGDWATATGFSTLTTADVIASLVESGLILHKTTIATAGSQTGFTLTTGSADNSAYRECVVVFIDQATATQRSYRRVSSYSGATKTVSLAAAPDFTIAAGDIVAFIPVPYASDLTTVNSTTGTINSKLGAFSLLGSDTVHGRLPAALVGGRMSSDAVAISGSTTAADNAETCFTGTITTLDALDTAQDTQHAATAALVSAVKTITDALGATAAARLNLSAGQIIPATVDTATNSHTPTTTEFQADDVTEATPNHYNGRIIIFTSGNLAGQATSISGYSAVGGIGQFTVVALTEAPSNDDTFIIL